MHIKIIAPMKRISVPLVLLVMLVVACSGTHDPGSPVVKDRIAAEGSAVSKTLVAYQSKYGSTRQYAEWIGSEIKADVHDLGNDEKPDFSRYDIIIFGGYFRMGGIPAASVIKDNWQTIKRKRIVLFTASGTPPDHPDIQKVYGKSLPEEIRMEIKYFPLRGRLLQKDMGFFDSFLVSIGRMMEKDETLRAFMSGDFDGVRKENIQPLLDYLKGIRNN